MFYPTPFVTFEQLPLFSDFRLSRPLSLLHRNTMNPSELTTHGQFLSHKMAGISLDGHLYCVETDRGQRRKH